MLKYQIAINTIIYFHLIYIEFIILYHLIIDYSYYCFLCSNSAHPRSTPAPSFLRKHQTSSYLRLFLQSLLRTLNCNPSFRTIALIFLPFRLLIFYTAWVVQRFSPLYPWSSLRRYQAHFIILLFWCHKCSLVIVTAHQNLIAELFFVLKTSTWPSFHPQLHNSATRQLFILSIEVVDQLLQHAIPAQ